MKNLLNFLVEVGKLKRMPRMGWVLRGIDNPETIADHTFRMTLMTWILCCKKKLNISKALKMSLIHDLCEVYAGDTTPFDCILSRKGKKGKNIFNKWPRLSKKEKEIFFLNKCKKENKALRKITSKLPPKLRKEIINLWDEYEKGLTLEGRFVRQVDRVENLLQALEYWKKGKKFKIEPWWIQIEELVDDPLLLKFIKVLEKRFHKKK
ncbi:MAG: HD domain-containing protein [Candidatus Nealsonbacteria bacterium]|nr:HD domain-containing protein [Candidatus Nealsonbacteria bacterium]